MKRWLPSAVILLLLCVACSTPPPHPTFADLRFTQAPAIRLAVSAIDVRIAYQPTFRAPNVEHLFPVAPARAAENWAQDRLVAAGGRERARLTIANAAAIETELPRAQGLKAAVTDQPAQRYDVTLEAKLEIVDDHGLALRTASVRASRTQSVLEGITPNEREQAWYDMTKALLEDFDRQMESEIRGGFGKFVQL